MFVVLTVDLVQSVDDCFDEQCLAPRSKFVHTLIHVMVILAEKTVSFVKYPLSRRSSSVRNGSKGATQ